MKKILGVKLLAVIKVLTLQINDFNIKIVNIITYIKVKVFQKIKILDFLKSKDKIIFLNVSKNDYTAHMSRFSL